MTKQSKILGVPFHFAVNNIALFVLLMLVFYVLTRNGWSLAFGLGVMVMMHLVMRMLSLKEDQALAIMMSNFSLCGTAPFGETKSYSPLKAFMKKPPIKESPSSQHLPWSRLLDEHTIVTKRGDLIQVLTLEGLNFYTKEDSSIDENKNVRNRLFYQMAAPELAMHFYLLRRNGALYPEGAYPPGYAHEFNERIKEQTNNKPSYHNALYIALIYKAPKLKASSKKEKKDRHAKGLHLLNEQSARIIGLFKEAHCRRLGADSARTSGSELLSFLSELVNLEKRFVVPPKQALSTYLASSSHHFAKRRGIIQIRGVNGKSRFAAMLSLKEHPEETQASLLDSLLSAQSELMVTQSFYFKEKDAALRALSKQQRMMAQNDGSVMLSEAIEESMEEIKAGKAAYGEHHLSICVMAESIEALDKNVHAIESRLNEEAGLMVVREEAGVELAFWAQFPGNHAYRIRQSLVSSLNLASFVSLHNFALGKAKGNHWGDAICMLETLSGTPFYFNIHVGQVGNAIFIGPMGSGKTLMLSSVLALTAKFGGWRFVFDKDRGMEAIVRALGGSYKIMEPGKPSGMSPLKLRDTPENRAFNVMLLKKILGGTGKLTAQEEKTIEKAVMGAYGLDEEWRLYRHIAPFFGACFPGSLRERFDRWHSEGQNAWLFDNEEDAFAIDNHITGQDIGKLLAPAFEEVSTPALMYLFHRISECLDSSPAIAFVPEGWKALSDPMFRTQLMEWSKTPRKNNMALIMDTQSPEELALSPTGSSIAREAQTQVFFASSKAEWAHYRQFNLSLREFEIIREELPHLSGHYFLLKQGTQSTVVRLNLSGLEQDLPVLSCNLARAKLLDQVRARIGNDPESWLPYYTKLSLVLESEYKNSFPQFVQKFDEHWVDCA